MSVIGCVLIDENVTAAWLTNSF